MKQILKYTKFISGAFLTGSLLFTSCTDQFEKWNINPNEVTPEQMTYDNLNTGAYFTQMVKGVFIVGKSADGVGLGGRYQITEMLTGDIFASYIANINTYSYTTYHNDHYALYRDWYNAPFNDAYTNVMQPWKSIVEKTDESWYRLPVLRLRPGCKCKARDGSGVQSCVFVHRNPGRLVSALSLEYPAGCL